MTAFDKRTSAEANAKQQARYPDLSAEMRRRANLRKTHGTGTTPDKYGGEEGLSNEMIRRAKIRLERRRAKAKQTPQVQDNPQSQD